MEAFDADAALAPAELPASALAVQTVVVWRAASAGYITGPGDDPGNTAWPPRLVGDVSIAQSALDGIGIGGRVALTLGAFDLWDADGQLRSMVADGTADGRRILIRLADVADPLEGDFGTPLGSAVLAFRGTVRRIDHTPDQYARVAVADAAERLAMPLQSNRYGGTGGTDGPASLAGKPKPVALGTLFNVAPVYLGSIDLGDGSLPTYQAHWRAVDGITSVRIRGVEQSPADPPGVGEFKAWDSLGMFQLGGSPDGAVTCDLTGDEGAAFVSTTAGIVKRLVTSLGPQWTDDDLQLESFVFADTDMPGAVGWYRGIEEITAEQAAAEILAGAGAVLCGGRNGTIRIADLLAAADAQFSLAPAHVLAIEPVPMPATLRPLPRSVAVGWARNWAPLTDIAGSVGDAERTQLAQTAGTARASSDTVTINVLQQREMRIPGLYFDEADALARAERWRDFLAASPRAFRVVTDRYLDTIEIGDVGWLTWPSFGLNRGAGVVVAGWEIALASRRIALTLITVPWVAPQDGVTLYESDTVW